MIAEEYGRCHRGGSESARMKELVAQLKGSLAVETGARKTAEASVRKQKADIEDLRQQLTQASDRLKNGDLERKSLEKSLLEAQVAASEREELKKQLLDMQVALESAKEEGMTAKKRAEEAGASFIEVDRKRIEAEGRAVTAERKVLTAVEDFKDSSAGISWCQELSADSVTGALDEVFAFVRSKAPNLDLSECPHYVEPEVEDNIDSGDEEDILDDLLHDDLVTDNVPLPETLPASQSTEAVPPPAGDTETVDIPGAEGEPIVADKEGPTTK